MKRGYLFHDYTPNVSLSANGVEAKRYKVGQMDKPILEKRTQEELALEENMESKAKQTAYSILVDEVADERDNYEEDESGLKQKELTEAIGIAKQNGDEETAAKLEALLKEYEEEQDPRLQEEMGKVDASRAAVADNPPLESKSVKELVNDFENVDEQDDEVRESIFNNISSKLTSTFQKNFEQLKGPRQVMDSVDMHEYAKLVNASYMYFEHRDFNQTKDYIASRENAYIPKFNEWQVNETYSSADNLVFVKYGRDLNNPTVVISCRGTVTGPDWITNVNMVAGGTEQVSRFKQLEETYHQLQSQYPEGAIKVTGHSQGGGLSYALAQKYNLEGYHYDPAVFPTFRQNMTSLLTSTSPVLGLMHRYFKRDKKGRATQHVFKNAVDPVSMMMSVLDTDKNVKIKTVDVKSSSSRVVSSPHSLTNYFVDGYDGDISKGVPVQRGGNARKILEPFLKRAAGTAALRQIGKAGSGIAVGLTVNDTYHALKKIDADGNLSKGQKRLKKALTTTKNVADFAVSAGVGMSAEAAAAGMLTTMGATGAVAVGAPLLMGAAAALVASQAIRWIGGSIERHTVKKRK
jgi:hypothetical protein